MKFKKVQEKDEIYFHGVKIEREYHGTELKSVSVIFEDDNFFKLVGKWDTLELLVKHPPEYKDAFKVTATIAGKPLELIYDQEYKANEAMLELTADDKKIEIVQVEK